MKTFFKYLVTAVMLLCPFSTQAQSTVYPIQLNAVMLPPYTNCLGDYFNSGANRAQVKAILRDISRYDKSLNFSLSVKVKLGNTVLLESVTPYPIVLSNANVINDLREYVPLLFSPAADNKGVRSSGNYATNGYCLPEGSYEFVFQAFDYYKKNVPLSEPFSMFCYLNQAEAPIAVYPEDGACDIGKATGLGENGVQFQWMDPIAYGPSQKVYEFVLTEKNSSTNLVGNMFSDVSSDNTLQLPVFSDNVYNNNFRYIPTTSNFQKGKEYCWYVVAKGGNITGQIDPNYAFKNNGKSNVNCFTYGDCPAKEVIFDDKKLKKTDDKLKVVLEKVDVNNENKNAEATWKSESGDFCKYYVYYYRKDLTDASAEKAEIKDLTSLSTVLKNLEPGYEYSCYVIGATNCDKEKEGEILSPKSNEISFKLKEKEEGNDKCEANLDLRACENLLEELNKKDYFFGTTNSEIITVSEVTKNTDNSFSGKGIVSCSVFKNKLGLNVTFDNIFINTERYLCKGEVKVVHDDTDNLVINLNEIAGKKQGAEKAKQQEHLGTEVSSLEEAKNHKNETIIFEGKLYAVDSEGNPVEVGEVKKKEELCDVPKGGLDNEDGTIVFDVEKGLNGDKYDPYIDRSPTPFNAELVKKSYEWQSSNYPIAWVSMVEGEVRWITAEISDKRQSESALKLEDIDFYCYAADGSAVKLKKETYGSKVKLNVYGGTKNTSLKIYARVKAEKVDGECPSEEKTVGVVNIYSMSHQTKKILLAPVLNEMTLDNLQQMQDDVNKMFAPLGKKFEFTKGTAFTADNEPELELILMDGINTADGAKHFSKETDEMKYIRQRYTQFASDFSDYDACLFLIPTAQKMGLQGYMPLNKSVGYIIVGEDDNVKLDANTIAHELCHGLYDIQHVFDYNGVSEGALPENIMDYPELNSNVSERYLTKYYQWVAAENGQLIHLSFLDDTEDAEGFKDVVKCMKNAVLQPIKTGGICLIKATLSTAFEEAVDFLIDKANPQPKEVHFFDKYCSYIIPFAEQETKEQICGFARKYGVNAFTCIKDQCEGNDPIVDNLTNFVIDFINCWLLNTPTKPFGTCLCENGVSAVFGGLKDFFISPKIDWKINDLRKNDKDAFEYLLNDMGYRFQSVLTGIGLSAMLGANKNEVAEQIIRGMFSKDEQKIIANQLCEKVLDLFTPTNPDDGGGQGSTNTGGQGTTNKGQGANNSGQNITNNGGQGTTNKGQSANNSGQNTTNNGGQGTTNSGQEDNNDQEFSNNKSSITEITSKSENTTKDMAIKVFAAFLHDVMKSETYKYEAKLDFHDLYTYKKMLGLINKNKDTYFNARNSNLTSPKKEIADSISKLIIIDSGDIVYSDNYDYVRKVCALVASKLNAAKSGYSETDYNQLSGSNCRMCNYSNFKAMSDILQFAQKKCGKSQDSAYKVGMFIVNKNYLNLPFILEHIDE